MVRIVQFFCLFLFVSVMAEAQIMGASATKLTAFHASILPKHEAEFEPTFGYIRSTGGWDDKEYISSDTINIAGSINWRLSYSLFENLELGFNVLSDASFANFALKTNLLEDHKFSLGAIAGLGLPMGSSTFDKEDPSLDDVSSYAFGILLSYAFDSLTSLDFNVQYQDYFKEVYNSDPLTMQNETLTNSTMFVNADLGTYKLHDKVQMIIGAGYQSTLNSDNISANLFLESGVAFEFKDSYAVTLAIAQTAWGRNAQNSTAYCVAFTTLWN